MKSFDRQKEQSNKHQEDIFLLKINRDYTKSLLGCTHKLSCEAKVNNMLTILKLYTSKHEVIILERRQIIEAIY